MQLRKYEKDDANKILTWIDNERTFRLWSADRYQSYPISADEINLNYELCSQAGNFYPMTLVDENNSIIGHLIIRTPGNDNKVVRLGFIIVDNKIRGKGYGKTLLRLAIEYSKKKLGATEINLGVFKNNESAYGCYSAVGFHEIRVEKNAYNFNGESWDCVEMKYNFIGMQY